MATNFPSSLDTATQQPSPSASDAMDATGKEHATVHTNHSGALIALETKMGTGTSNAASASDGHVLTANGSGGSAWAAAGGGGGLPTGLTMSATAGFTVAPDDVGSNTSSSYPYSAMQIKGQSSLADERGATIHFTDKSDGFGGMIGYQGQKTLYIRQNWSSHFYIQQNVSSKMIATHDCMYIYSDRLQPQVSNAKDLGSSSVLWRDAFVVNGVTTTSDVNEKKEIKDTTLGLDFINALRPVEYKWKDGGVRKHQGFIAQEVKTVLDAKDKSSDQGMWGLNTVKNPKTTIVHHDENDEDKTFDEEIDTVPRESLRYNELIGPLVKAVQELTTQNEALTARIATLEG